MGTLLRDYHTVQVPPERKRVVYHTRHAELAVEDLNTIVSSRDYRCDAAYTVALSFSDTSTYSVHILKRALLKPTFALYLGRKSCPLALPLNPRVISAPNLRTAFESYNIHSDELSGIVEQKGNVYWEEGTVSGYDCDHVVIRRDTPVSRGRWQFSDRRENCSGTQRG